MEVRVEIFGVARQGGAWHGTARLDTLRGGIPAAVGPGPAKRGFAWHGAVRRGAATHTASYGVQQCGRAGRGPARRGGAWRGYTHCPSRRAEVWHGGGKAWIGRAKRGTPWLGLANTQHPCGGAEVCLQHNKN